jgi:branched-subunit amino acid ABC-type transport system permease component
VNTVVSQTLTIFGSAALLELLAVGLTISFLLRIINLGYGAFITIGAYVAALFTADGVPFFAVCALALALGAAIGAVAEVSVVRKLYRSPELSILGTFGLSVVITQLIQLVYGSGYRSMTNPFPGSVSVLGTDFSTYQLTLIAVAAVVLGLTVLALRFTPLGVRIRAAAADVNLAETLGIRSSRLNLLVFAGSAGLAGLAGALLAPISSVDPTMGQSYLFSAFIVVIVAGTGRVATVFLAAFLVAAVQDLTTFFSDALTAELSVLAVALVVLQRGRLRNWKAALA